MSVKGYKAFNSDWTGRDFQYKVGKTYKYDGEIELGATGFHFCQRIKDCFNYYDFSDNTKVAEVEAIGLVETWGGSSVTNEIKIVRELTWDEVLNLIRTGRNRTGKCSTG